MSQTVNRLEKQIIKPIQLQYLLHLPQSYDPESSERWPLILFLHGAGERGDDIEKVKIHGIPMLAERNPSFPFIAVSPQCPKNAYWHQKQDGVMALLDEITANYNVDDKRIYLTGLSMGGYGTWNLACDYPDKFAAIAPICGGGDPYRAKLLVKTPVWAFHGAQDTIVLIEESERMVEQLQACGSDVRLTVYPEAKHNAWTETYENPELYEWMLSHSR
ncbi:carboxylesterase family protein [Paenibacillus oceani]|uniref:Prolyl oligopeptidase family serine peptidase n=1 Tax=Paenibacillus oceani TaxID=2772510 RepID=A0A927GZJ3_9BACL|nr:prolyl oligopeptidase family serine peptidase [Paenibacillus oceani]MBD2863056.1 prolyl oligopeptidase family serine peptidase [Paenibacillus oceani]